MFGMLDYRAHKLYLLIFSIPNFVVWAGMTFVYPLASYVIAAALVQNPLLRLALAIGILFILGIVLTLLISGYTRLCKFLFEFFIDVIPADGRSEDEAKAVLFGGQRTIDFLKLEKHIRAPEPGLIERIAGYGAFSFLFRKKILARLRAVSDFYRDNPDKGLTQPLEIRNDFNRLYCSRRTELLLHGCNLTERDYECPSKADAPLRN